MKNNTPLLDKDFIEKHWKEFELTQEIAKESVNNG